MLRIELLEGLNETFKSVAVKQEDYTESYDESALIKDLGVDSLDFSIAILLLAEFFEVPAGKINEAWKEITTPLSLKDIIDFFEVLPTNTVDKTLEDLKEFVWE